MNKVARIKEFTGPKGISLVEEEIPSPKAGEVLVKMKAAGLNRVENMISYGQFPFLPELPGKIGFEGAGIIERLGDNIEDFQIGDEVSITPNMAFNAYGVIANYAVVPGKALIKKPSSLSWIEAAALWMGYGTAYAGIVNAGGLKQGANQTVVISAASSSVGLPAIQIAKAHGAKVIATSRTLAKEAALKDVGADFVVATNDEQWTERVLEATSGKGFDIAFDPITGPFTSQLAEVAGFGATIVSYGTMSKSDTALPLFPMLFKALKLTGIDSGHHLLGNPAALDIAKDHIVRNLENSTYHLKIDSTFSLEQVVEAYQRMESGQQIGKIVIEIA
ncbi:hypothetical protein BKI52_15395 [marine bacterium AO1-C]|nr:hypothetical protein BKI52_15395 [marine bacterium AO1-C]